jgi:polyhydroxyalkanoate synthesis regulator phasin
MSEREVLEAVARIIQPEAWYERDRYVKVMEPIVRSGEVTAETANTVAEGKVATSLARAKTLLADVTKRIADMEQHAVGEQEKLLDARARIRQLREALKPFADIPIPANAKPHWPINYQSVTATYKDVLHARGVLEPQG